DRMDERFDQVEAHLSDSDRKISEIQMTLENEVNKKISIVAEGHCDLVRKLDEALRIENENEILLLRLTGLEGESTRIKKRLEEIA
ncbi:MAG: hypothetical protein LUE31_12910, partial [Lachnospiraceae bacterium]|nr:hypothetical protein [Lachnospiraceae bacterium]